MSDSEIGHNTVHALVDDILAVIDDHLDAASNENDLRRRATEALAALCESIGVHIAETSHCAECAEETVTFAHRCIRRTMHSVFENSEPLPSTESAQAMQD